MGKIIGIIVGVIVLLGLAGAGGFYGGTVYAATQAASVRTTFFAGRGGTGAGAGGAGGAGGAAAGGGGGGGVAGTVSNVNGNTLTVTSAAGVATNVTVSSTTTIMKSVTGVVGDLQTGQQVTVRGARDSSGNVAATSIQVVPAGTAFGGGNGGGARATATPAS